MNLTENRNFLRHDRKPNSAGLGFLFFKNTFFAERLNLVLHRSNRQVEVRPNFP